MYTLPDLDYAYDALAPHISEAIMKLHHQNHHQAYVDKLNAALESAPEFASVPLEELLTRLDEMPEGIRKVVRDDGGGHYNHSQFWKWLSPNGGGEPTGTLADALIGAYGSFQAFIDAFDTQATGLFGSGWVWLMPDMTIQTSPNQDSPLMTAGPAPILGLDVWEHAYYLDYTYKRADYIKAWWNVVNWREVEARFEAN